MSVLNQKVFAYKNVVYTFKNCVVHYRYTTTQSSKRPGKKQKNKAIRENVPKGFQGWTFSPRSGSLCIYSNVYKTGLCIYPQANVTYTQKYKNPFVDINGNLVSLTNQDNSPSFQDDSPIENQYRKQKQGEGEYSKLSPAEAICFWHLTGTHAYPPVTAVGFYAGFFIGEGSFGHEWSESRQYLSFSVTQNYDRINVILGFKSFCNDRGHLYISCGLKENKKTIDWICTKNEELLYKIIPALDKLPLVGLKKEQYNLWKSHFLFAIKYSRSGTGKNTNDRRKVDIYNSYITKVGIIDRTPTASVNPEDIDPGLLSGLVSREGGIKTIFQDRDSGVLTWWIYFRQHKNSKAMLEAVKIAWLKHMDLPENQRIAINLNTPHVLVFILKNKEQRKAFSAYIKAYPVYDPRLEYELRCLDTFLQKLPAKKWNKVPADLKEESKRILDHLRSHDPTQRYDFHYPSALSLLYIIREVLGKKINIDFLPYSLQRILSISMLNCFGEKAIINMNNYINEKATKQCIQPKSAPRTRNVLVVPENAEQPNDIPFKK